MKEQISQIEKSVIELEGENNSLKEKLKLLRCEDEDIGALQEKLDEKLEEVAILKGMLNDKEQQSKEVEKKFKELMDLKDKKIASLTEQTNFLYTEVNALKSELSKAENNTGYHEQTTVDN